MTFGIVLFILGVIMTIVTVVSCKRSRNDADWTRSLYCGILAGVFVMLGTFIYFNSTVPTDGKIECSEYIVDHIKTEKIDHNGDTIVSNRYVIWYKK